jgi:uncharacterized protein (UPF0276 family)
MYGIGLRHQHFSHLMNVLETKSSTIKVDWFEGITENFFDTEGRPLKVLERIRRDFPIGLHGVSLSIGSSEDLNMEYLKKVKRLYDRIDPMVTSDHLCWTGHKDRNLHNLLPIPYNDETLSYLVQRIQKVQDYLGRPLAIENLSAYFDLNNSTYKEWDFLCLLAQKSGCKILLDINNIFVNSVNHKFDPLIYVQSIPNELVSEIHLAGFTDMGTHLFDTHSCPVWPAVWDLFQTKIRTGLEVPVLVEWDEDIPDFEIVENEAMKAKSLCEANHVR